MYVIYHLIGSFVILKWNLYQYAIFFNYNNLVNFFYIHKYSYIFELIKLKM